MTLSATSELPPAGLSWGEYLARWVTDIGGWLPLADQLIHRAGDAVDIPQDPQTVERGIVQRARHPKLGEIPVVGTPLHFSRMAPGVRRAAPLRGEHTDAVLTDLGYSAAEIQTLRDKKATV